MMTKPIADIVSATSLRVERVFNAPPERVWAYLTEGDRRMRWFCGGDDLTRNGQSFDLRFNHARFTDEPPPERYKRFDGAQPDFVSTGEILAFEPPRRLRFAWSESANWSSDVTIELSPEGGGTRLVLTHAKLPNRAELIGVGAGWNAHFNALEDEIAGRRNARFWSDHVRYEAILDGLAPQPVEIHVSRRYATAPERVFDAWLDAAMIGRFMFGPHLRDEEVVSLSTEARIGGRFSYRVRRQGQEIDHKGTYREIDRPRRLVFTWGVDREEGDASVVTIEITPDGGGCMLTLTHRIDPAWADYAERTREGWAKIAGDLAAALAA